MVSEEHSVGLNEMALKILAIFKPEVFDFSCQCQY